MTDLELHCWQIRAQVERDLSLREITEQVLIKYPGTSKNRIADAMSILRSEGKVDITANGQWTMLQSPPEQLETMRDYTTKPVNLVSNRAPVKTNTASTEEPISSKGDSERWQLFRRFVRYYIDCFELMEMPNLRNYVDRNGDSWIPVESKVAWDKLYTQHGIGLPKSRPDQAAFTRNREKIDADTALYIGYPVELCISHDGNRWLLPVISQPIKTNQTDQLLECKPGGLVRPNQPWLEKTFKKKEDREAFMRFIGLSGTDEATSDTIQQLNVGLLAPKIQEYIGDKINCTIQPHNLDPHPDWTTAEPGIYNCCLLSMGPRYQYTKGLLNELRDIAEKLTDADLDKTALKYLFEVSTPTEVPTDPMEPCRHVATTESLNEHQEHAVKNALNESLSAITGPPGTGKSVVVRHICLNQLYRGKSVLFGSNNHGALDAVELKLNELSDHGPIMIRTARKDLGARRQLHQVLKELLNKPARNNPDEMQSLTIELKSLLEQRADLRRTSSGILDAKNSLEERRNKIRTLYKNLPVLLQNTHAQNSLRNALTSFSVKDIDSIQKWEETGWFGKLLLRIIYPKIQKRSLQLNDKVSRDAISEELLQSSETTHYDILRNIISAQKSEKEIQLLEDALKHTPNRNEINDTIASTSDDIRSQMFQIVDRFAAGDAIGLNDQERRTLSALRSSIENFGQKRIKKVFMEQSQLLLKSFPLWATTTKSAGSTVPLVPGCFDLLVIDEASQCDIVSSIPLLARCKRAVVVGDPMQLQHVSNMDQSTEQELLTRHKLLDGDHQRFSYRVNSLYDCITSSLPGDKITMLREHFRCHPSIAHFASESFYASRLLVRTDDSYMKGPSHGGLGLQWDNIIGPIERPGVGGRGVHSPSERKHIIKALEEFESSQYNGTIGVVTPFSKQKQMLSDEIHQTFNSEFINKYQLKIDTAHGFQGDERDVIFLSLCCGPDMPDGSMFFVGKEKNLFNVAVTRARAVLRIVGNRDWAKSSQIDFIKKAAHWSNEKDVTRNNSPSYDSIWEERLHNALRERGIDVIPQYPVAGRRLDLAALTPTVKIDIEVDGECHRTAGGNHKDDDIWRDQQMQACGWTVCRFWVYQLKENMNDCVSKIEQIIEHSKDKIEPDD